MQETDGSRPDASPASVRPGRDLRRWRVAHLYRVEGLCLQEIAWVYGVSVGTVLNDLRALGVPTRARGGDRRGQRRDRATLFELRRREIEWLYADERLTEDEISWLLPGDVHAALVARNVPRRSRGPRPHLVEARVGERQALARRSYESGLTGDQVGRQLGVDASTVYDDLEALGVARRHPGWPTRYPPAAPRECRRCGKTFTPKWPSWAIDGRGQYDSRRCAFFDLIEGWPASLRRRFKCRLAGRKPPAPGGRPRGRPRATANAELVARVEEYAERGWGYRTILEAADVREAGGTEYRVREILAGYRERQQALQQTLFHRT